MRGVASIADDLNTGTSANTRGARFDHAAQSIEGAHATGSLDAHRRAYCCTHQAHITFSCTGGGKPGGCLDEIDARLNSQAGRRRLFLPPTTHLFRVSLSEWPRRHGPRGSMRQFPPARKRYRRNVEHRHSAPYPAPPRPAPARDGLRSTFVSVRFAPSGKPITVQTRTDESDNFRRAISTQHGFTQTVLKLYSRASRQSRTISLSVASGLRRVWSISEAMD